MMIYQILPKFIIIYAFIGCFISSQLFDSCSKWDISGNRTIFGQTDMTAGNDDYSLNLSNSYLDIDRTTNAVAVLDDNNRRILVFNQSNSSTLFAILFNSSNLTNPSTTRYSPSIITYAQNNSIYIADGWEKQLTKIDNPLIYGGNSTSVTNWTQFTTLNGQVSNTSAGLCIDKTDGSIFLSDQNNHQIIYYKQGNSSGTRYVGNGTAGNANNQLNKPTSIVLDDNQTLFVNDVGNKRVQMFAFNSPIGITLPTNVSGCILALSLYLSNILLMNTKTSVYLFNLTDNVTTCAIGCNNSYSGLTNITNAVIDNEGNLIVSDSNRVLSYPVYGRCQKSSSVFVPFNNCSNDTYGIGCSSSANICNVIQPCQNNGTCNENKTITRGYTCECPPGFSGPDCQTDDRPCKPNTCLQRGNCTNTTSTEFECHCNYGYEGQYCQSKVNFCAKNITCENGGVCFQEFLNFTCHCLPGFSGRYCEITETANIVRAYVSRSFAYIAIIMLACLIGFFVIMDALKYIFGIDPVQSDRNTLRHKQQRYVKKKNRSNKPKVAYRFQYVN